MRSAMVHDDERIAAARIVIMRIDEKAFDRSAVEAVPANCLGGAAVEIDLLQNVGVHVRELALVATVDVRDVDIRRLVEIADCVGHAAERAIEIEAAYAARSSRNLLH